MEPMTEEQLAWVDDQVHRAANKASDRTRNRALVAFLVLGLAIAYVQWDSSNAAQEARQAVVDSGTVIAVDGCNRDFKDRLAVRGIFIDARNTVKAALKKGQYTEADAELSFDYYDRQLRALPLPDCREAQNILTADPDHVPPVPEPLHP